MISLMKVRFLYFCFSGLRWAKFTEAAWENVAQQSKKEEAEILQARSGRHR